MSQPPASPKIFHITHVDNLARIVAEGVLVSDAIMTARGGPSVAIGMSKIKQRRLTLPVRCHQGTYVGEYLPFYFCPRLIMLYVIHCANSSELAYRDGQEFIVHLQADLHTVIQWATTEGRRWAFSLSNAGAYYAEFRATVAELDQVDWQAVESRDFRSPIVSEPKQAEFLVFESFPWALVERIGVRSVPMKSRTEAAISGTSNQPPVVVSPEWYY